MRFTLDHFSFLIRHRDHAITNRVLAIIFHIIKDITRCTRAACKCGQDERIRCQRRYSARLPRLATGYVLKKLAPRLWYSLPFSLSSSVLSSILSSVSSESSGYTRLCVRMAFTFRLVSEDGGMTMNILLNSLLYACFLFAIREKAKELLPEPRRLIGPCDGQLSV